MAKLGFRTLRGKILAATVSATAVLLLCLGAFMMFRSSRLMEQALEAKVHSLLALAEQVGIPYINNFDYPALDVLVKEIVKDPDVEWLVFLDAKGTILTKNSEEKPATPRSILVNRDLTSPGGKEVLARLKFSYSTGRVATQLKNDMLVTGAAIFLCGFFMTVLIALITNRVIRPIRHAADLMQDIAEGEGDLTKHIIVTTRDEVGALAKGFNTFVEKIRNIVEQLSGSASTMASFSSQLSVLSRQMGEGVEAMSEKTRTVAAAAEEASASIDQITKVVGNVNTIVDSVSREMSKFKV